MEDQQDDWLEGALITVGLLGWSNKCAGLEFYHSWGSGRWDHDQDSQHWTDGWGRLLAREPLIAGREGAAVVVVAQVWIRAGQR